nr:hypothetical protein [Tanacetum cinerariifolium]
RNLEEKTQERNLEEKPHANNIPESTYASRDPVMQFVIQNFEQINAMYSTFSLKRKEVHPTSIPKTDDHPVMKPWHLDLEGLTKRADQEAPKDNTPPDNPTNRGKVAAENPARRMIATPGEPDLPVLVPESFHEQTDEELTENDIKRMDADDQAIQTILLGLPEDAYVAVDSVETAKKIWELV